MYLTGDEQDTSTTIIISPVLAPGVYAVATNGEQFPIQAKSNIAILGATVNPGTIFGGANVPNTELLRLDNIAKLRLANLTFRIIKPTSRQAPFSRDSARIF